jgi:hypothetical protein
MTLFLSFRTAKTEENQKMLNELQGLISKIPKNKRDLFDFKINWNLLAKVATLQPLDL